MMLIQLIEQYLRLTTIRSVLMLSICVDFGLKIISCTLSSVSFSFTFLFLLRNNNNNNQQKQQREVLLMMPTFEPTIKGPQEHQQTPPPQHPPPSVGMAAVCTPYHSPPQPPSPPPQPLQPTPAPAPAAQESTAVSNTDQHQQQQRGGGGGDAEGVDSASSAPAASHTQTQPGTTVLCPSFYEGERAPFPQQRPTSRPNGMTEHVAVPPQSSPTARSLERQPPPPTPPRSPVDFSHCPIMPYPHGFFQHHHHLPLPWRTAPPPPPQWEPHLPPYPHHLHVGQPPPQRTPQQPSNCGDWEQPPPPTIATKTDAAALPPPQLFPPPYPNSYRQPIHDLQGQPNRMTNTGLLYLPTPVAHPFSRTDPVGPGILTKNSNNNNNDELDNTNALTTDFHRPPASDLQHDHWSTTHPGELN